jgi:hypothetical protein
VPYLIWLERPNMLKGGASRGRAVRSLVVIVVMSCVAFGASRAHADEKDKITLPPLDIWLSPSVQPDYLLDFKGDKTPSAADTQLGKPPIKKEEVLPFIGLSLTRPFDFR